jgi:hypothetical protein
VEQTILSVAEPAESAVDFGLWGSEWKGKQCGPAGARSARLALFQTCGFSPTFPPSRKPNLAERPQVSSSPALRDLRNSTPWTLALWGSEWKGKQCGIAGARSAGLALFQTCGFSPTLPACPQAQPRRKAAGLFEPCATGLLRLRRNKSRERASPRGQLCWQSTSAPSPPTAASPVRRSHRRRCSPRSPLPEPIAPAARAGPSSARPPLSTAP